MKRKELNRLLGFTVLRLKDKVVLMTFSFKVLLSIVEIKFFCLKLKKEFY